MAYMKQPSISAAVKDLFEGNDLSPCHVLSVDEKLLFLSQLLTWMEKRGLVEAEQFHQFISCEKSRHRWTYFLKCCLQLEEDRYVLYIVRKLLTKTVGMFAIKDDYLLMNDILSSQQDHLQLCGLQVCRDLFSDKLLPSETVILELGPSILQSCEVLKTYEDCAISEDWLFEVFSVLHKMFKQAGKLEVNNPVSPIMRQCLLFFSEFVGILFVEKLKNYLKCKLIKLFCSVLKLYDNLQFDGIRTDIFHLAVSLYEKVEYEGWYIETDEPACSVFTGKRLHTGGRTASNIRDKASWISLCLCTSGVLAQCQDYLPRLIKFLLWLDEKVKEALNRKSTSLFPWLPDLFGDQDDKWIDAMEILLGIFVSCDTVIKSFSLNGAARKQHHTHFLQFTRIVGYDHLVLIDLLTSPETNFLSYFVKYLKHLLITWDDFKSVTEEFFILIGEEDEEFVIERDEDTEQVSMSEIGNSIGSTDDVSNMKGTELEDNPCVDILCRQTLPGFFDKNISPGKENSHTLGKCDENCQTNDYVSNHESSFEETNKCNNKTDMLSKSNDLGIAKSLSIIADSYGSDDDDHDDDDKFGQESVSDPHYLKGDWIEVIDTDIYSDHSASLTDGSRTISESCKVNGKPIEDSLNKDTDAGSSYSDRLVEDLVLDKVMGMMIRTRMKLEKLWSSGLLQYDPAVLVSLLENVEELYEGS